MTVIDRRGAQLVTAEWAAPTGRAADLTPTGIGWARVNPRQTDWEGRRSAPVTPAPDHRGRDEP